MPFPGDATAENGIREREKVVRGALSAHFILSDRSGEGRFPDEFPVGLRGLGRHDVEFLVLAE